MDIQCEHDWWVFATKIGPNRQARHRQTCSKDVDTHFTDFSDDSLSLVCVDCHTSAHRGGLLLLECAKCHAFGIVDRPSLLEWRRAFHAPERVYEWHAPQRVTVRSPEPMNGYLHVVPNPLMN